MACSEAVVVTPDGTAQPVPASTWSVYIVECADGSLYTGIALRLEQRIAHHNSGKGARYTRSRLPVQLVYHETCPDKSSALKRELAIKALPRAQKSLLVQSQRKNHPC